MKTIYDNVSFECSKITTQKYSTSFSIATKMLSDKIRQDIYNIYGFVRLADEIVDSFHDYDKEKLFNNFEEDLYEALNSKISLNPILNSFQYTFHKYNLDLENVQSFMKSMRLDLNKGNYMSTKEYQEYIYGSADVVGLMCLKVFVDGNLEKYNDLKSSAMSLGSAFQKVNFLRDLKADLEDLNRSYFPNVDFKNLTEFAKKEIINDIENDFKKGFDGIQKLPLEAKFGVYTAYRYYKKLLDKLKQTPALEIKSKRIRIDNLKKISL